MNVKNLKVKEIKEIIDEGNLSKSFINDCLEDDRITVNRAIEKYISENKFITEESDDRLRSSVNDEEATNNVNCLEGDGETKNENIVEENESNLETTDQGFTFNTVLNWIKKFLKWFYKWFMGLGKIGKTIVVIIALLIIASPFSKSDDTSDSDSNKPKTHIVKKVEHKKVHKVVTKHVVHKKVSAPVVAPAPSSENVIQVDTCDFSGTRQPNTVADVGYGDRQYFAYTNSHAQLVKVTAANITLQNEVSGRYCNDEANVPGVESSDLDKGHAIADSLGGASNAYNITPEDSHTNRYGEQAKFEKEIRNALKSGSTVTDFIYKITYPDSDTQIPNHYEVSYKIDGVQESTSFDNNANGYESDATGSDSSSSNSESNSDSVSSSTESSSNSDSSSVDTSGAHWGKDHTHCYMPGHRGSVPSSYCS